MIININDQQNINLSYYENEPLNNLFIRTASNIGSMYELLYIKKDFYTMTQDEQIDIYDFMSNIINARDFETLYNEFIKFKIQITKRFLIELYMLNNKQFSTSLRNAKKEKNIYMEAVQNNIFKICDVQVVINEILKNKTKTNDYINSVKTKEKQRADELINEYSKLKDITIQTTDFIITDKNYIINLELKEKLSLCYIFNILHATLNCPFIFNKQKIYKVYDKFIVPSEWLDIEHDDQFILVKFCENIYKDEFIDFIFKFNETNTLLQIIINLNTELNINDIFNKFINQISLVNYIKTTNITENKISGKYTFKNIEINKFILLDIIMNNKTLNNNIVIDETILRLTQSIKGKLQIENKQINFFIKQIYENTLNSDFKIQKNPNIEIIINDIHNEELTICQDIFKNVFQQYLLYFTSKLNYYSKYVSMEDININSDKKDVRSISKILNLYEPDIFLPNYSRLCANPPNIYNKEIDIEENRKITFPLYPDSVAKQTTYYCKDDKYRFPGLIKNNMNNSNIFKYLPCCYLKNQKNKLEYILKYEKEDIETDYLIKTNKILGNNKHGYLPDNISNFFNLMDINSFLTTMYLRQGCYRNQNSFLISILNAFNTDEYYTESEYYDKCNKIKQELQNLSYIGSCKQELYDLSQQEIINQLANNDTYFDPECFIRMVEIMFECKIIILQNEPDNIIKMPRFRFARLNSLNNLNDVKNCIFILEHYGQYDKNKSYPQCELIYRTRNNRKTTLFDINDNVVKHVLDFINN